MSNLVPTPRTDKNGRQIIRHMKPVVDSTGSRTVIPTVGELSQQISTRNALMSYFKQSGWRINDNDVDKALGVWEKKSDATLPLLHRVLTNSDRFTLAYMDGYIGSLLLNVIDSLGSYGRSSRHSTDDDTHMKFQSDINRRWHALTVSEESGYHHDDPDEYFEWIYSSQSLLVSNYGDRDLPQSDAYWRGVAALTLIQLKNDNEIFYTGKEVSQAPGFVEYAGNHPDIKKVLDVASPRFLFDHVAIQEIIEEQEAGAPVLSNGVL